MSNGTPDEPLDRGLRLVSSNPVEAIGAPEAVVNEAIKDEFAWDEQQSLQAKVVDLVATVAELRDSNHKLRVENVVLRARNEQLKSNNSLERKLFAILGISLWFLFLYAIVSKILHFSALE